MHILPPRTAPATTPTARRHAPQQASYGEYRACLRWDFGFTCAFCLLHESDLSQGMGVEGLGLMWIEHRFLQSTHESERDRYENCIYACRLCNQARGTAPLIDTRGHRLLDPTETAWAEHFEERRDLLEAKSGDVSAARAP
jgi:hypothetical protein